MSLAETGAKSPADWRFGTEAEYVSRLRHVTFLGGKLARVILEVTAYMQIRYYFPLIRILDSWRNACGLISSVNYIIICLYFVYVDINLGLSQSLFLYLALGLCYMICF